MVENNPKQRYLERNSEGGHGSIQADVLMMRMKLEE